MIALSEIQKSVVTWWGLNHQLRNLVPGGLWIAGAVPSNAQAPYASYVLTEGDDEFGSSYVLHRYELTVTVWSDGAALEAGRIATAVETWMNSSSGLVVSGGSVVRVRPGPAEAELSGARDANDITITRNNRRITIHERLR